MGEVRSTDRAGDGRQAEFRVGEVRSTDRAGDGLSVGWVR